MGHLVDHKHHELAAILISLAQHTTQPVQKACILASATPQVYIRRLPLEKIRKLGWLITFVE